MSSVQPHNPDTSQYERGILALRDLVLVYGNLRDRFAEAYTIQWLPIPPNHLKRAEDQERYQRLRERLGPHEVRQTIATWELDEVKSITKELIDLCVHAIVDNHL